MASINTSSIVETRDAQEQARKNYGTGKFSISDYIEAIFHNPLKFSSSNRTHVEIVKLRKGKIRITVSRPKPHK